MFSEPVPMKDRPFVRAYFSRQIRKLMTMHFRLGHIKQDEYDQLMAKARNEGCVNALCDLADEDEDFNWDTLGSWISVKWDVIRGVCAEFNDMSLTQPGLYYNSAPAGRGRKARRAAGPAYQTDVEFLADKEEFERERREDK